MAHNFSRRQFIQVMGVTSLLIGSQVYANAPKNINVADFGAVGDGVTDDSAAINKALSALSNGGGTLNFDGSKKYFIGKIENTISRNFFILDHPQNLTLNFNGATLLVNTAVQCSPRIFYVVNPKNLRINDLKVIDLAGMAISGSNPPNHWGAALVRVQVRDSNADMGGLTLSNIYAQNLDAVCIIDGWMGNKWAKNRLKNIVFNNINIFNCYYGVLFQNNGDNVQIKDLRGENVRRLYYPYGISNHDVEGVIISHGPESNAGSTGCLMFKVYDFPTKNINARFKYKGEISHAYIVSFDLQPDHQKEPFVYAENISLTLDVTEAITTRVSSGYIGFRSYSNGVEVGEEIGSTENYWKNIKINLITSPSSTMPNEVVFNCSPSVRSTIYFKNKIPRVKMPKQGWLLRIIR